MADRFVLRWRGDGPRPAADVERLRALPATVVHEDSSRMLLIESDGAALRDLMESLPGWVMAPEQIFTVPDTRPRVERPPS